MEERIERLDRLMQELLDRDEESEEDYGQDTDQEEVDPEELKDQINDTLNPPNPLPVNQFMPQAVLNPFIPGGLPNQV